MLLKLFSCPSYPVISEHSSVSSQILFFKNRLDCTPFSYGTAKPIELARNTFANLKWKGAWDSEISYHIIGPHKLGLWHTDWMTQQPRQTGSN